MTNAMARAALRGRCLLRREMVLRLTRLGARHGERRALTAGWTGALMGGFLFTFLETVIYRRAVVSCAMRSMHEEALFRLITDACTDLWLQHLYLHCEV